MVLTADDKPFVGALKTQDWDRFAAVTRAHPALFQVKGTSFTTRLANEGGEATVQGTLMLANGERVPASFQLVKERDYTEPLDHTARWMLLGYRIGDLQVIAGPR